MSAGFWQSVISAWGYWPWTLIAPLYVYAQLRGDSSARSLAGVLAIAALLGTLFASASLGPSQVRTDQLGLDAVLLAALVLSCIRSRWLYPIVIAAGQLLIVLVEVFAAAGFAAHGGPLEILIAVLALMQFAAFGLGLALHRSRRPLWRVRAQREIASAELAPRANDAR